MDSDLANHINNINSLHFFSILLFSQSFHINHLNWSSLILVRWTGWMAVIFPPSTDEYAKAREAQGLTIAL